MTLISDFPEYHHFVRSHQPQVNWLFRGQANVDWPLLPKLGRTPFNSVSEKTLFESWQRWSVQFMPVARPTLWESLVIAQHHGLATRLLDWTRNPLNAAYFALSGCKSGNAVVYAAGLSRLYPFEKIPNPFEVPTVEAFLPPAIVPRVVRQHGVFTIHPNPKKPIEGPEGGIEALERIEIKRSGHKRFMSDLVAYGAHTANLFPDLDGLASFLNWSATNDQYGAPLRPPPRRRG